MSVRALLGGRDGEEKAHTPEQIIGKLREAEVEQAKGQPIQAVCKKLQITE